MAKIANVALTNTFDYWRIQSNKAFDRVSQFSDNNSKLYANTVVANNVLKALGNTVLGAAGKLTIITGRLTANGRVLINTNLAVTGNTILGGAAGRTVILNGTSTANGLLNVTDRLYVSGNTFLGAAGKTATVNGVLSSNGRATVSTNLAVTGNTTSNKAIITSAFTVSGNTTLGAAGKTQTSTGAWGHTGTQTITGNQTVTGNTSANKATVTSALTVSGNAIIGKLVANGSTGIANYALKTNGTTVFWGSVAGVTTTQYLEVANAVAGYVPKANPATSALWAHTGRATISTNLAVTGNTSTGKGTVTASFRSTGNNYMGGAGKKFVIEGVISANGMSEVTKILRSTGNNVFGAAGKKTIINGTSVANGYLTVTSRFDVSGNTNMGGAGKKTVVNGLLNSNGRMTILYNMDVSGNTNSNKITATSLLTASGNTALGAAGKTHTSIGIWTHTGNKTVTANMTVSGNTTLGPNVLLPSGSVINWNSGDATLTHTTNTLTFAGASIYNNAVIGSTDGAGLAYLSATGDIHAYRTGGTTGVIFLNSADTRYLYYDGSGYVMPGAGLTLNGGTVWHSGNDGAGSGLDADTVDGIQASAFATAAGPATSGLHAHTGRTTISTNLTVSGNTQTLALGVGTTPSTNGSIRATNNITAYYSDERLKVRLENIPDALAKVNSLSGFYFHANELSQSLGYQKKREVGVSAQEVQRILPEVVVPAPISDLYLTVHYEKLIPLLIEAIKELDLKVKALENR